MIYKEPRYSFTSGFLLWKTIKKDENKLIELQQYNGGFLKEFRSMKGLK